MTSSPHVLIIGAGLAGPAMALALARNHIRSTVFERRAVSQDIGGVLMLAPNAVRVLDRVIGIEDEVRKLGFTFDGIEMHAAANSGEMQKLGRIETDNSGYKGFTIKRPVLHQKLLELCEKEELVNVEWGKKLKGVEEREEGVTAVFEDETRAEGDILLGIDGIYSQVRSHVLSCHSASTSSTTPLPAITYTGHVVLGSTIPRSHAFPSDPTSPSSSIAPPAFLLTQAGSILSFPNDPSGEIIQWAAFMPAPERDRKDWEEYRKSGEGIEALKKTFGAFTEGPIPKLLEGLTPENTPLWAPYAVPDLPTWHTNRCCLMGDAAHAISPSAGQGTAQALEDVGLMTRLLSSPDALAKGYPALFSHYEARRKERMEVIRKFTEGTLKSREPTPSWMGWTLKKAGLKAFFAVLSGVRSMLPAGTGGTAGGALSYDVMKESIAV